jgi:4-hydroxy-3-methylbut-2-enyl diphosphate reductase IspH
VFHQARSISQAGASIPLEILQGIGVSKDTTDPIRERQSAVIDAVCDSVQQVVSSVGRAGVSQVNQVKDRIADAGDSDTRRARTKH